MPNNFNIKYRDHFKLYVLLKDKIIFESGLINNGIDFYIDENQSLSGSGIRYFLADKDRLKIDALLKENEIIASTETINILDYRDTKKVQKLYLYIFIIAVLVFMLIILL